MNPFEYVLCSTIYRIIYIMLLCMDCIVTRIFCTVQSVHTTRAANSEKPKNFQTNKCFLSFS